MMALDCSNPWLLICVVVTGISTVWLTAIWIKCWKSLSRHFFFLFFYTTVVVFLQIAPLLSLLAPELPLALAVWGLSHPRDYVREYAMLQAASLLLFQLPLVWLYFGSCRKVGSVLLTLAAAPGRAQCVALGGIGFAILFLLIVIRDRLFFTRIGSEGLSQLLVSLPFFDFFIYRSYQESALFLLGVLYFLRHLLRRRSVWIAGAFWLNLVIYGYISLLNSRNAVVLLAIMLFGWRLMAHKGRVSGFRRLLRVGALAGVGAYLCIIVVNVRMAGGSASLRAAYLNPFGGVRIISDSEGFNRFDGIDLMARLAPGIQGEGPAWGAAWKSSYWLVGRFIDPQGFDASRLSMTDTAKGFLMRRYWGWETTDYQTCRLTDMFGNFYLLGFPILAGIYAVLFVFCRRAFERPSSGKMFLLGLFVLVNIMMFEGTADVLLFGWVRKLPVLLVVLAVCPFIVRAREKTWKEHV
jgi:hypothetical protein